MSDRDLGGTSYNGITLARPTSRCAINTCRARLITSYSSDAVGEIRYIGKTTKRSV
jgi:hypothetical protein